MPWAINGTVSTDKIDGGVQITNAQYQAAIEGIVAGKVITIDGGFQVIDPPEPEPETPVDPEPDPNDPYIISKTTPWLRMTDDEAELLTGAMQQANARQKAIYDAASYLNSGDPLWSTLHDMIAVTLNSSARADELLAPET